MFHTIVTGVDGSEGGRDALRLAAELAAADGARIIAVGAFPAFHRPALTAAPAVKVERDRTQAMLDRELAELGIAASTHVVADASPGRALHLVAEREDADLIVVGSTRRGVIGRVLVGDDALGTLHGAHVPVAVAPRGYAGRGSGPRSRIGVGFDDREESRQALELAAALARAWHAELHLLSVIDSPQAMMAEAGYSMDWADDLKAKREERLRAVIDRIGGEAHGHVVIGTPVEELVALSERVGLVVVGSRAWGPLRRVLVGSTAAGVMRRAACPVIVLPRGAAAAPARRRAGGGRVVAQRLTAGSVSQARRRGAGGRRRRRQTARRLVRVALHLRAIAALPMNACRFVGLRNDVSTKPPTAR